MYHPRLLLAVIIACAAALPVAAQFTDQNDSYLRGRPQPQPGVSFGHILNSVGKQVGGTYMGQQFDPVTQTYRLRYIRNGTAVDVYVDARTGRVVGREGF